MDVERPVALAHGEVDGLTRLGGQPLERPARQLDEIGAAGCENAQPRQLRAGREALADAPDEAATLERREQPRGGRSMCAELGRELGGAELGPPLVERREDREGTVG